MSNRKRPYKPKPFESNGRPNDTSANIYESMLLSDAFQDLTKSQRLLYLCMKAMYYGKRKPGKDFPEIESLQSDDLFYFNFAVAEKYGLYTKSNKRQFYKDIHEIEAHGFIRTVSNGRATKSRSIYKYTGDWKEWSCSS